jgi:hypothetical protein
MAWVEELCLSYVVVRLGVQKQYLYVHPKTHVYS